MIMLVDMHRFSACGMQQLRWGAMMMRHWMQPLSWSPVHTGPWQT